MNSVHIHLLLNHVSIMAAIFSVLVFAYGFFRRNSSVINIALAGFVLAALAAIPVFLSGEPAEEAVEHLPGVVEAVIEEHEEAAEIALWLIEISGLAALTGLVMRANQFFTGKVFYGLMLVLSLVSAGSISYAGYLGGKIRHTEIASAGGEPAENVQGADQYESEEEDDD